MHKETPEASRPQDGIPIWLKAALPLLGMLCTGFIGAFTGGWRAAEHLTTLDNAVIQLQKQIDSEVSQRDVTQQYLERLSSQVDDLKLENARDNARIFTILHDHWRDVPMMPNERDSGGGNGHIGLMEPAFAKQQPANQQITDGLEGMEDRNGITNPR